MKILSSFSQLKDFSSPVIITIGNFDGVHCGHQDILKRMREFSGSTCVVTFQPHPQVYFGSQSEFKNLFSVDDQEQQLENMGMGGLLRLTFNHEMANKEFDVFLDEIKKNCNWTHLIVGYDLKIGKGRKGNLEAISNWCRRNNVFFEVIPPRKYNDEIISSTRIRELVEKGSMGIIPSLLGRFYSISGDVKHGDKRGRAIGFPTANLTAIKTCIPRFGVYASLVYINGQKFNSITNVGSTPTFKHDNQVKIESHIFNFSDDIYGQLIRVEFLEFIRPEQKFSGLEEIKVQIQIDIDKVKRMIKL